MCNRVHVVFMSAMETFGVWSHVVLVPLVYRLGLTSVSHAGSGDNFPETWGNDVAWGKLVALLRRSVAIREIDLGL
jgi:hypothetical protein